MRWRDPHDRGRVAPLDLASGPPASPSPRLADLQSWFQREITRGVDERLSVYREMYGLRLELALAADYPTVARLIGAPAFAELCRAYVLANPSRTFTLDEIDAGFARFAATWPEVNALRRAPLLDALFLDRVGKHLAWADESQELETSACATLALDQWDRAILRPIAALRLVRSASGGRRRAYAVWRRRGALHRMPLSDPAVRLLADLTDGLPLATALERVELTGSAADHVGRWLLRWTAAGFFTRIDFV